MCWFVCVLVPCVRVEAQADAHVCAVLAQQHSRRGRANLVRSILLPPALVDQQQCRTTQVGWRLQIVWRCKARQQAQPCLAHLHYSFCSPLLRHVHRKFLSFSASLLNALARHVFVCAHEASYLSACYGAYKPCSRLLPPAVGSCPLGSYDDTRTQACKPCSVGCLECSPYSGNCTRCATGFVNALTTKRIIVCGMQGASMTEGWKT